MATLYLDIPEDLLADLQAKALAEGKSVEDLATEALTRGLEDRIWTDLLAYGQETARASGYSDEDVPRLVKEWRREQRDQRV
jgi:hypothetical protein